MQRRLLGAVFELGVCQAHALVLEGGVLIEEGEELEGEEAIVPLVDVTDATEADVAVEVWTEMAAALDR